MAAGMALAAGAMALGSVIGGVMKYRSESEAARRAEAEAERQRALGREAADVVKDSLAGSLESIKAGRESLGVTTGGARRELIDAQDRIQEFREGEARDIFQQERDVGSSALQRLQDVILGGDMSSLQLDPGYEFRLSEGNKAIERAAAAAGSFGGSSNLRDFGEFSQGLASQEYANAIQRLSGLQAIGSQANRSYAGMQGGLISQQSQLSGGIADVLMSGGRASAGLLQTEAQLKQQNAANQANALQSLAAQQGMMQAIGAQGIAGGNLGTSIGNAMQAGAMGLAGFGGGGGTSGGVGGGFQATAPTPVPPSTPGGYPVGSYTGYV